MSADQRLAVLAARQLGLIRLTQARRAGLSDKQIHRRLASGRWERVASGVYRLAGAPATWRQQALAAVLAAHRDAVASHLTAAALHGLAAAPECPHITVPRTAGARLAIARVHRSAVGTLDRCRVEGIPVTTPTRTLLDLAAALSSTALPAFVDDAFSRGLSCVAAVLAAIDRAPNSGRRPGAPALRRAIEVWTPGIEPGSPAEVRLLRRLADWGFAVPETQLDVHDERGQFVGRLDVAWPDQLVALEYDSDRFHGPRRWDHDERRAAALRRLGWQLRRVSKSDLLPSQTRLRDELFGLLARRAS